MSRRAVSLLPCVLGLLALPSPAVAGDAAWLEAPLAAVRAAEGTPSKHAQALSELGAALAAHLPEAASPPKGVLAALPLIEAACGRKDNEIRYAGWRAAAAISHARGEKCLAAAFAAMPGDQAGQADAFALSEAVRLSRSATSMMLALAHIPRLWAAAPAASQARASVRGLLEAAARATGTAPISERPEARARTALLRAYAKVLPKVSEQRLREDLLIALALAPARAPRTLLARWFKEDHPGREAELLLVLAALGDAGDSEAVPFLLAHVPDTQPAVAAACIVALHKCEPSAYRQHVRLLGDVLAGGLAKESKFLSAIMDSKRKEREPLLARARAIFGSLSRAQSVHALLWKVVDANAEIFADRKPPPPSRGLSKRAVPGGGNVVTILDWGLWWKAVRKHARRR